MARLLLLKVWVGGTKSGKIAFLGETKFAPGEWAGVALDDALGKNDGTVGGVSYFKCAPMHGVFSRASRLSRQPLASGPPSCLTTPRKVSKAGRASMSPSESVVDLKSGTPSPTGSTISLVSMAPLKLGDRVIVGNAVTGTKMGTLRFMGPTEFAQGDWGGVELDSAIGKNDGMVGDKRYFECPPNFGLFAPLHKITKSPKARMQRQPSSLTPRKLNRERSDLSEASMASMMSTVSRSQVPVKKKSIASIMAPERLKMSLKEKEDRIDQLLMEREQERAQIAKAASQTDVAEGNLSKIIEEYGSYKREQEERALTYRATMEKYEEKIRSLKNKLEDEKRKHDDVEFRLEEETMMRSESDAGNSGELIEKIRSLEDQLAQELKAKADLNGGKSAFETRIADLEGKLGSEEKMRTDWTRDQSQMKIEMDNLAEQLETEHRKNEARGKEVDSLKTRLVATEDKLKEARTHLDVVKEESGNRVFESEEQIIMLKDEVDTLRKDLDESKGSLEREEKNMAALQESLKEQSTKSIDQISELEKALSDKDNLLLESQHKLDSLQSGSSSVQSTLEEKSRELKENLKLKQDLKDQLTKAESEIRSLKEELDGAKTKVEGLSNQVGQRDETIKSLEGQKTKIHKQFGVKSKEIDELKSQLDKTGSDTQVALQEKSEKVIELSSKLEDAQSSVVALKTDLELEHAKAARAKADVEEAMQELSDVKMAKEDLEKEIRLFKDSSQTSTDEVKRLSGTINSKDLELEMLRGDLSSLTSKLEELKLVIDQSETEHQDQLEQIQKDAKKTTHELEEKLKKSEATKEKAEKAKEEAIGELHGKIRQTANDHDDLVKSLRGDLSKKTYDLEGLQSKFSELEKSLLSTSDESSKALTELRQKMVDMEIAAGDQERAMEVLKEEIQTKTATISDLESIKESLEVTRAERDKALGTTKDFGQKLANSQGKLSELAKEKIKLEEAIHAMQSTSVDSDALIGNLNDELKANKAEVERVREELEQKVEQHQKDLDDLAKEQAAKGAKMVKISSAKDKLELDLETTQKDNAVLKENSILAKAQFDDELTRAKLQADQILEEQKSRERAMKNQMEDLQGELKMRGSTSEETEKALKDEKSKRMELEEAMEKLRRSHEEEVEELVDVVNELRSKEIDLADKTEELELAEKSIKDLNKKLGQHHKELDVFKEKHSKEIDVLNKSLEESKSQIVFLKESMGGNKVEYDLQMDKFKKQIEAQKSKFEDEMDKKTDLIKSMKDDITNKEEELEFAKEELEAKIEEFNDLNTDLEVKEASFDNSFKETDEKHKDEIEVLVTKIEEARAEVADLSETLAKTRAEHDSKMDEMMSGKKSEVNSLQDQISERDRSILDLKASLEELEGRVTSLNSSSADEGKIHEAKVAKITSDNEDLRLKKKDLESTLKSLQADFDQLSNQNEDLSIKVVEREHQVREYTSQVQTMKVSYEKSQKELTEKAEKSNQDGDALKELEKALDDERIRVDELQIALAEAETERDSARSKSKDFQKISTQNVTLDEDNENLKKDIEELKHKLHFAQDAFESERTELNEVVQKSKVLLQDKVEEFKSQKREFDALVLENQQLNSYRRKVMILEQEKRELESQVVTLTYESRSGRKSPSPAKSISSDMNDGELKAQVDFLNSVIVDMQRKNDDLKTKLEIFESAGIIDSEAEANFMFNGVSSRSVAPRLFCDICDVFDIHDTEDCPTQAMEISEPVIHTKSGGARGQIREYCDTCEVFGHSTANCNEGETF
eukprot:snap_masked-scaffold94_size379870-processed-gene-2.5 protein:Tk09633 transcript:snap_masked-scaffold94_size379870-processed-gene-2.5-mRNA-1 annotation:"putative restin"